MLKSRFHRSFSLAAQLSQTQFGLLLALFGLNATLTISMEDTIFSLPASEETTRIALHLTMGAWELVQGALFFLVLSWGIPKVLPLSGKVFAKKPFAKTYLSFFAAEYLRMIAQTLLWSILLLLPGFYRYAQLLFVPYIALFSDAYRRDEVDALQFSTQLTRKRFGLVFGVFLLTVLLQIILQLSPQYFTALHNVPMRVTTLLLGFLISIWTYSFMFNLFAETLED